MSLSEREYVRRSWKLLSAMRASLRTEHNVRLALLFGSAARGTDTLGSDVDVLVALRDPDLERMVELADKLTVATGRRVELVRLEDAKAEPSFLADLIADGRVLVDREGLWTRLRSREPSLRRAALRAQMQRSQAALAGIDPSAGAVTIAGRDATTVDAQRLRLTIVRHLEDLPRQYAALEHAMASFGADFGLQQFKEAYDTAEDMDAYNRVQAVERALGRVQSHVGELAHAGVKLAALPRPADRHGSTTQTAFEAMRDAKIISARLCGRLVRAQNARARIEHSYLQTPAGDVHRVAILVRDAACDFLGSYRGWIEPYLNRCPSAG
jgi:predicted nucleotidyltransferase